MRSVGDLRHGRGPRDQVAALANRGTVRILGTNHCGEMQRTAFQRRELFQDVPCRCDFSERVVTSFDNQIKSEYYGVNRSVSTEGIVL